jgi:3-oxoacyl-[acyl-carrier-protein] synthase-1
MDAVMPEPMHVVALAARTAVGLGAGATAAAIRASVGRIGAHPTFADGNGEPVRCGFDAALGPAVFGTDRLIALGRHVLLDAAQQLARGLPGGDALGKVPLLLACPEPRPGFTRDDAQALRRALGSTPLPGGISVEVREAGAGHAGVLAGIAVATAAMARGEGDLYLVGGVDGYLDGTTIDWLEETRRLDRAGIRGGFPPGEGATMIALTHDYVRRRMQWTSHARVLASAVKLEKRDPDGPEGLLGEAMTEVLQRLGGTLRPGEQFDDLYCDINGERPRTTDLGFALIRTAELFRDASDYRTGVTCVGDLGAATGGLSCLLAARAWARGYASGPNAVAAGSSWSGLRAAVRLGAGGN